MRTNLTPFDIANTARMTRTLHPGAILIVEGTTDSRVYERFVSKSKCKLIPAHGKDNAIGALSILEKKGVKGILTIIDADFWRLDGINPKTSNLLLTPIFVKCLCPIIEPWPGYPKAKFLLPKHGMGYDL